MDIVICVSCGVKLETIDKAVCVIDNCNLEFKNEEDLKEHQLKKHNINRPKMTRKNKAKFTNEDVIKMNLQEAAIQEEMQIEVERKITEDKLKSQVRLQKEIIGAVVTELHLNDDGEIDVMELEKDGHKYIIASISYNMDPQDDTAIEIKEKKEK